MGAGSALLGAGLSWVFVAAWAAWPLVPPVAEPLAWKYFTHVGSTLPGSFWYWSYISSTSHSLAPKSAEGCSGDWLPEDCGTGGFASSGYARGDGFQSSRLDPRASKCSGKGGLSGGVLRAAHHMRD